MRLFVAVVAGSGAAEYAADVRRAVERHDAELARRGLKWVERTHLHLTLRFMGDVAPPLADEVVAAVDRAVTQAPFPLEFGAPSWLPGPGRPRVLMLPLVHDVPALAALKRAIDERLPAGVPAEEARPLRPHLTLARVRDGWQDRAAAAGPALAALAPLTGGGRVESAVLFESRLGPQGPVYAARARARLDAS
jgi:2'-5' RNA ligase